MYQPLADALRPQELSDVCGQQHILGENGLLRRIIESGSVPNMIFYGPSGTGKTTVANLIAKKTQRKLCKLNATTASSADIKEIYAQLDTFLAPNGVLLYLDEIQYFNKNSSRRCWSILKTARSHSLHLRRKTRISMFTTLSCRARRCLNSSPWKGRGAARSQPGTQLSRIARQRDHSAGARCQGAHCAVLRRRYPQGAQRRRIFFTRPHGPKTAWSDSPWQTQSRCHSARPCAMINPATIIMTIFPRS